MLFIIGFIFMGVASFCFALGTIFDCLGAAKEYTEEFKDDETVVEDTETTEEATEEE